MSTITVWKVSKWENGEGTAKKGKKSSWVFDRMDVAVDYMKAELREVEAGATPFFTLETEQMPKKRYLDLIESEE